MGEGFGVKIRRPRKPRFFVERELFQLDEAVVAAREELVNLHFVIEQTQQELDAARAELDESRRQHAAETARFREGLAAIRGSAEDALALEREAAEEIRARLRDALDQVAVKESEIDRLREELHEARGHVPPPSA